MEKENKVLVILFSLTAVFLILCFVSIGIFFTPLKKDNEQLKIKMESLEKKVEFLESLIAE